MDLAFIFLATSVTLGLPPGLLDSVCFVESGHNHKAYVEKDGNSPSHGICQLKLAAARQVGFKGSAKDLMKPETNIYYSGKFLRYQYGRYKNWARAVTAYNRGSSTGDGSSGYLAKVFARYADYRPKELRSKVQTPKH